jgi:hypothetical protein
MGAGGGADDWKAGSGGAAAPGLDGFSLGLLNMGGLY